MSTTALQRRLFRAGERVRARLRDPERSEQRAALAMRIASAGLGYGVLALAARVTTGVAAFSDFALVMAATALFGAIGTVGQETLLLRRLPVICADGLRGFRATLAHSAWIVALGLGACAVIAASYGAHAFERPSPALLVLTGVLVLGSGAAELLFAVQRGSGAVLGAVFRRELVWKLVLFAAIAATLAIGRQAETETLAGWYLAGTLAADALALAAVVRLWRAAPATGSGERAPQTGAGAFFMLNFIVQAGTQLDVLVLGLMAGVPPAQLGAYYAAQRTIQVLYILPYGASTTSAPRIPLAWAAGDRAEIGRLSHQISRGVAAIVALAAGACWLLRGHVMALFRPEFVPFAALLPVLALAPLFSALGGLHGQVPLMCGLERPYARWRLALILGFLVLKVLAARYGSLLLFAGVSAAESLAITTVGVIMARRRLGIALV